MEESTLANEWLAKGEQRGELRATVATMRSVLLRVLRVRFGDTVTENTVVRIEQETDLEILGRWLDLAAIVPTAGAFQAAFNATATPTS